MTEVDALQLIRAAAERYRTSGAEAVTMPDLARALRWLDQRIVDIVNKGRVTIRIGMPAKVRDDYKPNDGGLGR